MNPLERCNPIGLQSPLQQNKSWYRLATRPSDNAKGGSRQLGAIHSNDDGPRIELSKSIAHVIRFQSRVRSLYN